MKKQLDLLTMRLKEIAHLNSMHSLLVWDMETQMPKEGAMMRGETVSHLSVLIHQKVLALDEGSVLTSLKNHIEGKKNSLSNDHSVIVAETWRTYAREKKLPESFVRELSKTTSEAHHVWVEARKASNFKKFAPHLKKIVELKRKEAKLVGYKDSPYDALIDQFEPGMTSAELTTLFDDLKDFLVPFIAKIKKSKVKASTWKKGDLFPKSQQIEVSHQVCKLLGYDFERGMIAESAHPFSTSFNPDDARFTTRYDEKDLRGSLYSSIHELGHSFYEQGLLSKNFGTPLGEAISLGIHESQSRFWENVVGRSAEFSKFIFPTLKKAFPKVFSGRKPEDFYKIVNNVTPSFIRTESDEVTYNMHVIIRFEIEKELIEGSIEVSDVPKIWNDKMKSYLGITVKKPARPTGGVRSGGDSDGALQDVHWSGGMIGYFPTYTLGNLYSLQFWNKLQQDIPDAKKKITKGEFKPILAWLRKHIHIHGKRYSASALVRQVTGEELTSAYFIDYLKEKYGKLYNLK